MRQMEMSLHVTNHFGFAGRVGGLNFPFFHVFRHLAQQAPTTEGRSRLKYGEYVTGETGQYLAYAIFHSAVVHRLPEALDAFPTAAFQNFFTVRTDNRNKSFLEGIGNGIQEQGPSIQQAPVFIRTALRMFFSRNNGQLADELGSRVLPFRTEHGKRSCRQRLGQQKFRLSRPLFSVIMPGHDGIAVMQTASLRTRPASPAYIPAA